MGSIILCSSFIVLDGRRCSPVLLSTFRYSAFSSTPPPVFINLVIQGGLFDDFSRAIPCFQQEYSVLTAGLLSASIRTPQSYQQDFSELLAGLPRASSRTIQCFLQDNTELQRQRDFTERSGRIFRAFSETIQCLKQMPLSFQQDDSALPAELFGASNKTT